MLVISNKQKILIGVLLVLSILIVAFLSYNSKPIAEIPPVITTPDSPVPTEIIATSTVIGSSVLGRPIEVYTYGNGSSTVLFVGGMHGGYEWNSVLVAYDFIDELESGKFLVPENVTIKIIPALNPDGLYQVVKQEGRFLKEAIPQNNAHQTGEGRFNANEVDLNRNFACKWQSKSTWRGQTVSAGTEAFSEPEAKALKDLVSESSPVAVVFWHSQANNVYASECLSGPLAKTLELMNAYAKAGGYGAVASFDAYPVTGDAEGWLASINIPAITVELEGRTDSEWSRNRAGINALLRAI